MFWLSLSLLAVAFGVCLPMTALVRAVSGRMKAFDTPPVPGQTKAPARRVPNTGGVAIFLGFSLPLTVALSVVWLAPDLVGVIAPQAVEHLPGLKAQTPLALIMLACLFTLHVLGVVDDRKPLGPFIKLLIMTLPAIAIATFGQTRLLTFLDDPHRWPFFSVAATVLWFLIVTNAMNFMDNMDGLSAGVAAVASAFFMTAALLSGQWFVASCLGLLLGSLLGFLVFNSPPATIFMGDGGSLVIGFLLAFLTTRTTYISPDHTAHQTWYAVLMPLVVLAVPLYDVLSVTLIRLRAGRSPFVGDLNHLSHRLVRRGLSKRSAVATICALTAVTGVSGLLLTRADSQEAIFIGLQVMLLLAVVALVEFATGDRAALEHRP